MTDLSSIKESVAVVTCGAAGIGLACTRRFTAEGAVPVDRLGTPEEIAHAV